ncbi:bestrophin-like domain [Microcoleus sp. S28C3]|uniref:bestrophin-like domain n=1 Tax=Microcoleus sp. S28C3 TaxID=3055414 RepID=UPI00403FA0D4
MRRRFGQNEGHNEQVTFIVNVVGLFYGLLLGLVVVAVYQHYSDVQEKVSNEATILGVLYRDIAGFPDPLRRELQAQLSDYNLYLINEVWPVQQRTGDVPYREVTAKISAVQDKLVTFKPEGAAQTNSLYFSMQNLDEYVKLRRDRLYEVNRAC